MHKVFLKLILFIFILSLGLTVHSQTINGYVLEIDDKGKKSALIGANVYWLETMKGIATDTKGYFEIEKPDIDSPSLVVSFIGYKNDTLLIDKNQKSIEVVLSSVTTLDEAEIIEKRDDNFISQLNPIQTQVIAIGELQKAACCNLAESFETNASVDISYSDAVSGAKQIHLLGLAGKYSQIQTENIPYMRGLSSTYGLEYIPGTWMESIHISKGTSSVINGYESIAGQINIEYKKPENGEKLFINTYLNSIGKFEANANAAIKLNESWSTMLFGHYQINKRRIDGNDDGFMDQPLVNQFNLFNRWKYAGKSPWRVQLGIKLIGEERVGGQTNYETTMGNEQTDVYGIKINTQHYEVFAKTGYVFPKRGETSFGFINNFIYHDQKSYFGLNSYNGNQVSWYSNLIFHSYLGNIDHTFNTGFSFVYDNYDQVYNDSVFLRKEIVPGAFFEYTYKLKEKLSLLAGLRVDHHNTYGLFFTPRLHLKYSITEKLVMRTSIGKGYRTANIFSENSALMASSRTLVVSEKIKMEEALSFGINFTQYFEIKGREYTLSGDYYRTNFINQLIIDQEQDVSKVYFYNLDGRSYSNSYQASINGELIDRLDFTLAFRYNDVKTTINDEFMTKPLVPRYKGLLNLSYKTQLRRWQFDFTTQLNGDSRIPDTDAYPEEYQRPAESPAYTIINSQVTRYFRKWNIYLGVENLTNFRQTDPIIAANDPFGPWFDTSMVWGPITGRKFYVGLRLKLE